MEQQIPKAIVPRKRTLKNNANYSNHNYQLLPLAAASAVQKSPTSNAIKLMQSHEITRASNQNLPVGLQWMDRDKRRRPRYGQSQQRTL